MSRYYKNNIWLDEGIYILEAVVHRAATHTYRIRNYQMDYIEFTPSDSLTLKNNTATATVVIDKAPVSGKAILALYNGTKLVGTDCIDVTDERLIIVPAYLEDAITSAKVFVWDDFTNMTPQISPVNLSLN